MKEFKNEYPESGNILNGTKHLINKSEKRGTVHNTPGKRRKKMVMPEKQNEIIQPIEAAPTISSRHLESHVQDPHISSNCAMQETKFLYRIHVFQVLKPPDASKRLHFCYWLCIIIQNHHSILYYIFFSDKTWFHLSGHINTHNYIVWSYTNPRVYWKVSLHALSGCMVCHASSAIM